MNETPEVDFGEAPKPRKTRTKAKRAKGKSGKPTAAPEPPRTVPYPGLTRTLCADACNANGCAISCKPYCAHPTKGGLQAVDMNDPQAIRRLQLARDQLQVRIDPDRFT